MILISLSSLTWPRRMAWLYGTRIVLIVGVEIDCGCGTGRWCNKYPTTSWRKYHVDVWPEGGQLHYWLLRYLVILLLSSVSCNIYLILLVGYRRTRKANAPLLECVGFKVLIKTDARPFEYPPLSRDRVIRAYYTIYTWVHLKSIYLYAYVCSRKTFPPNYCPFYFWNQ